MLRVSISLMLALLLILGGCLFTEPDDPSSGPIEDKPPVQLHSSGPAEPDYGSGAIGSESSFLRGFMTADYDSRGVYFDADPIEKDMDQYRVISALRMLGYSFEVPKDSTELPHVNALERYKENHGIALTGDSGSEQVTLETLFSIDSELAVKEVIDEEVAYRFPFYDETVSDHQNGLSREFIAATMMRAFEALPEDLVSLTRENLLDCFVYQCYNPAFHSSDQYRFIYDAGSGEPVYYLLDDDQPEVVVFRDWMLIGPNVSSDEAGFTYRSGGSATVMVIHEYAHFLDRSLYPERDGSKRGIIDTEGFCSISWEDADTRKPPPPHAEERQLQG